MNVKKSIPVEDAAYAVRKKSLKKFQPVIFLRYHRYTFYFHKKQIKTELTMMFEVRTKLLSFSGQSYSPLRSLNDLIRLYLVFFKEVKHGSKTVVGALIV